MEAVVVQETVLENVRYFTVRADYVEDNRNGDAMRPGREDYAVYLRSPDVGEEEPVLGEWPALGAGLLPVAGGSAVGREVPVVQLMQGVDEGDAAVARAVVDAVQAGASGAGAVVALVTANAEG